MWHTADTAAVYGQPHETTKYINYVLSLQLKQVLLEAYSLETYLYIPNAFYRIAD